MEFTKEIRRERQPMRRILTALAVLSAVLGQPRPSTAQSGALQQLPPPHACTREDGDGVLCRDAHGILGAYQAAISQDGKSVYVVGFYGDTLAIFSRNTTTGVLTQLAAPNGCLAASGDGITCTDVLDAGIDFAASVVVSPDDKNVYVGSLTGIAAFARNQSTGQLTQLAGAEGCLAPGGEAVGCGEIAGPIGPTSVILTDDGKHLYAATRAGDAVGVFARDRLTGALAQLPAPAGCLAEGGDGITCAEAIGLDGANSVAVSRNGKQVYVASADGDTLAVFGRDRTTGALTQFPAPTGCIAENGDGVTCTDAVGLNGAMSVAISRTGRQVYVASLSGNSIAIFARNAATGALTQLPAPSGCVSHVGDGITCSDAVAMAGPASIVLTPNGRHAYVAAASSDSVVVFARDKKTGALTQLAAPHGCMSATGNGVTCIGGLALNSAFGLVMPKTAKHVYVTSYADSSIASFAREK